MHLKKGILTHVTNGEQILIGIGRADFSGFARSNETAAFIIDAFKTDTTRDAVVDLVEKTYDAPRERIEADVDKIIAKLNRIRALED